MLTDEQLGIARATHKALFAVFHWQSDQKTFDAPERWDRPVERSGQLVGDCDDWAMEMDARLSIIPLELRRIAVCRVERTSPSYDHCALILVDGAKLWVSECNSPALMRLRDLPYDKWAWSLPHKSMADGWETIDRKAYG